MTVHKNYSDYMAEFLPILNVLIFCKHVVHFVGKSHGANSTERCKFVRAKLRESFCPAAASHSRPRQAGA